MALLYRLGILLHGERVQEGKGGISASCMVLTGNGGDL